MKGLCLIGLGFFSLATNAQIRKICELPTVPEISGMVKVQDQIWVLNDGGNTPHLYQIDTLGKIIDSTSFSNAGNTDWEELCCNATHIFIGDFGNNNGTRKDLRIFRFPISGLGTQNVKVDTISFYYPYQIDFSSNPFTVYDCEAFLAFKDSIVLFSKSYADAICRVYSIPNDKGIYETHLFDSLELDYWVTGAAMYNETVTLCGYGFNGNLIPKSSSFLFGLNGIYHPSIVTLPLALSFADQLESVMPVSEKIVWGAAERSNSSDATLYAWEQKPASYAFPLLHEFSVRPNPADKLVCIYNYDQLHGTLRILDKSGKIHLTESLTKSEQEIDVSVLAPGTYYLIFSNGETVLSTEILTIY
jgi:hypothetical protein